jgi:hypothetical protein
MSLSTLTRNYDKLTADERLALILNAAARGDDTERERLLATAPRITLSWGHHNAHVAAFVAISQAVLLELLDLTGECVEALILSAYPEDGTGRAKGNRGRAAAGSGKGKGKVPPRPPGARYLDLFRIKAFRMTVEMAGWRLFCEGRHFPPLWLWDGQPGYERMLRGLALAQQFAFTAESMLAWLNARRVEGTPELVELPAHLVPEKIAEGLEDRYREFVRHHGG